MQLYQERDLGEVFNAATEFLGEHKQAYLKILLYLGLPYIVLSAGIQLYLQNVMQQLGSSGSDPQAILGNMGSLAPIYLLIVAVSILFTCSIFYPLYLAANNRDASDFTVGDLVSYALKNILPLLGFSILLGILLAIGFTLFVIPGFIAAVFFGFGFFAIMIEKTGTLEAFGRSRYLVRDHFWSILGLFLVLLVLALILSLIFSIPTYLFLGASLFTGTGAADALTSLGGWISQLISAFGSALLTVFIYVVLAMKYFSLVEEKDQVSLAREVSDLNNTTF